LGYDMKIGFGSEPDTRRFDSYYPCQYFHEETLLNFQNL
jgi:hypothetical protein